MPCGEHTLYMYMYQWVMCIRNSGARYSYVYMYNVCSFLHSTIHTHLIKFHAVQSCVCMYMYYEAAGM